VIDESHIFQENEYMTEFSIKRLQESLQRQHGELRKGNQTEHRSHVRFRAFARVKFQGSGGEESLLKDISVTGCCVECTSLADIQLNTQYVLEVIPEAAANIGRFNFEAKVVWVQPSGYSGDVGFSIVASPKGKLFQRYVDYLAWRDSHQRRSPSGLPEQAP
jgi:hypothetical protein